MTTWAEITGIFRYVNLQHPVLADLKDSLLNCQSVDNAIALLERFSPTCDLLINPWDYQGFHALLRVCFMLARNTGGEDALSQADQAIAAFRYTGDSYNEAVGHRIQGLLYQRMGRASLALTSLQRAVTLFTPCEESYGSESNYPRERDCADQIQACQSAIDEVEHQSPTAPSQPETSSKPIFVPNWPIARLVIGVQDFVLASHIGRYIMDNDPVGEIQINELIIDGDIHRFYSAQKGNFEYTLVPGNDYRWLKVAKVSMNQTSPTPICPNDLVLVDTGRNANVGDIVIAELFDPPTPQERAVVVKRYSNKGFQSESTEEIPPIPLDKASIRGVVLAVAKRIDPDTGQPFPPPGTGQTPP